MVFLYHTGNCKEKTPVIFAGVLQNGMQFFSQCKQILTVVFSRHRNSVTRQKRFRLQFGQFLNGCGRRLRIRCKISGRPVKLLLLNDNVRKRFLFNSDHGITGK